MNKVQSVMIIGGGLGGLALARSLRSSSINVKIFERDPSQTSRSQGYQLGLNGDGIKVLKAVNMPHLDEVLTKNAQNSFVVLDSKCNELMTVGGKPKNGNQDMAIVNRWKLRDYLSEDLDIDWNKKFVRYEELPDKVVAHFEDGTSYSADLLIGADGSSSKVRKQRCPSLTYDLINVVNISGYFPTTDSTLKSLRRYFAESLCRIMTPNGYTMLFLPFKGEDNGEYLVWSFSFSTPSNPVPTDPEQLKTYLLNIANTLQVPEITEAIESTPLDMFIEPRHMRSINTSDPDPFKGTNRVTLIGDAAHAMTTHRGIGGNTALMDAIDLSEALQSNEDWKDALHKYQVKMIKRGFKNANESLNSTRGIHMSGWKASARDNMMWVIGGVISGLKKIGFL